MRRTSSSLLFASPSDISSGGNHNLNIRQPHVNPDRQLLSKSEVKIDVNWGMFSAPIDKMLCESGICKHLSH